MRFFTWCSAFRPWLVSKRDAVRTVALATLPLAFSACVATLTPAVVVNPLDAGVDYSQLAAMKKGRSCAITYLYTFGPSGDATVAAAAAAGGLRRVRYVDNRYENNILRQKYCVVAYGE